MNRLWLGVCRCLAPVLALAALGAWVVSHPAQAQATAGKRVAFVVGNARYQAETTLTNPHSDAQLIAGVLRNDLKFDDVIERRDLDRRQMVDLVREIRQRATGADAVFVYFSGHGMQGPEGNYLIPVDARITDEDHVRSEALNARDIVAALRTANPRVAVLVLDACRDSPYARRTKSTSKGLSRMNVAGGNLLVAYATTEGTTADDGTPGNSPYARALAQHLRDASQPVLAQFDGVRRTTLQLTGNKQSPTREGDLEVNVYLTNPFAPVTPANRDRIEDEAWALCRSATTGVPCEDYLSGWPQGRYAALARTRLRELQALAARPPAPAPAPLPSPSAAPVGRVTAASAPGTIFRDCADCPELVVVGAGGFTMGSPAGGAGRHEDGREGPQRPVRIGRAFALGRYEVTVGEFKRFVGATNYVTEAERNVGAQGCYAWEASEGKWDWRAGRSWRSPGFEQTDRQPVVCVSHNDAVAYVQWLGRQTGQTYRLPSEAEWEYAARAGSSASRPWGDDASEACKHANVADQTRGPGGHGWTTKHECSDDHWFTAPVGSYQANRFGLSDMIGNVWERTQDCYDAEAYEGKAPSDGRPYEVAGCSLRVLRGGSWYYSPLDARAAYRYVNAPDYRSNFTGFRLARMLP